MMAHISSYRREKGPWFGVPRGFFFELWGDSLMPGHSAAPTALVLGLWPLSGAHNTFLKGTGRITLDFFPHLLLFASI